MKKTRYPLHKMILGKMHSNNGFTHIMLYGIVMAGLIFGLKWMQWNFLIMENAIDIYMGLLAILFTMLGAWIASQLIKPKKHTVFVEKQILIHKSTEFRLNQAGLEKLNLTNREYQILKLIVQGYSNSGIAEKLFLSLSTIKTHVSNLYVKMNVKSRFQAIALAKEMNIVE